jgi:hypothetical protein
VEVAVVVVVAVLDGDLQETTTSNGNGNFQQATEIAIIIRGKIAETPSSFRDAAVGTSGMIEETLPMDISKESVPHGTVEAPEGLRFHHPNRPIIRSRIVMRKGIVRWVAIVTVLTPLVEATKGHMDTPTMAVVVVGVMAMSGRILVDTPPGTVQTAN